jgi:hypothetical protein
MSDWRETHRDILALKEALGTLISWIAQSANSPITVDEARALLDILYRKTTRKNKKKA